MTFKCTCVKSIIKWHGEIAVNKLAEASDKSKEECLKF